MNTKKYKLIVEKKKVILVVGDKRLTLDGMPTMETNKQIFELVQDGNMIDEILFEYSVLFRQINLIDDMKKKAKVLSKEMGHFIQEYKELYKTKEYKQVISKFRSDLDYAFRV